MATSKKKSSSAKNRGGKKPAGKRPPNRGAAKSAVKRTVRGGAKRGAAKTPHTKAAPAASTRISTAALGREPERKPVKKAESRPNRPPAVLPIPQSTFFF
jgi:hypothetical protein